MIERRPLLLAVAFTLVGLGLIAPFTETTPSRVNAVSPARLASAPLGARLTIVGLVGDVHHYPGGGAAAPVGDCLGAWAPVYFPPGVDPPTAWSLAVVEGAVDLYGDSRELVAESAAVPPEGALVVDVEDLAPSTGEYACRAVAFAARVLSSESNSSAVRMLVEAGNGTLAVVVHLDTVPSVEVSAGARVSFVGVPARGEDGAWAVHVRA